MREMARKIGKENSSQTQREYLGWLLPYKNVQGALVLLLAQWH